MQWQNRITDDRLLVSTMVTSNPASINETGVIGKCSGRPKGSIYQQVIQNIKVLLETDKDYEWIIHEQMEKRSIRTLSNFEERAKRYGYALSLTGIQKGDIVCMLLGKGNTEVVYSGCGAWILGSVLFFGDVRVGTKALAQQLTNLGCKYLVCSDETLQLCKEASDLVQSELSLLLVSERNEFLLSKNHGEFIKLDSDEDFSIKCPEPLDLDVDNDIAVITFTSGTTGFPKAMMHTHTSAWNYLNGTLEHHLGSNDFNLSTIKIDTFVGLVFSILNLVQSQNTLVIEIGEDDFAANVFPTISKYKISTISVYTNYLVRMAESDLLQEYSEKGLLDSIKWIVPAASALPWECEERLRKFCPNLEAVACIYGTNETGIFTATDTSKHLGYLVPLCEIKIVSLDDPKIRLGPGEPGEICIRKPYMMKGYLNNPKETAKYFDKEGFAHIGDVGYYDEKGNLFFIERFKEMIKYNDFRVWPTVVEAELQKHPAVLECLVYGISNPPTIELVAAMVVLKEGFTEEIESDIQEFLKCRMEDANLIRGGITFCKNLPRNTAGKLLRREAREMAAKKAARNT